MDREELRNELSAVIAAAHELPREDEEILIDGFLDRLEPVLDRHRRGQPRPRRTCRQHHHLSRREASALFLLMLVPALAFGNPGVGGQPGFWCAWLLTVLVFSAIALNRTFGVTLSYGTLAPRHHGIDDLE